MDRDNGIKGADKGMNTLASSNSTMEKFNIRDTKKLYSTINDMALKGMEVITYNATKKDRIAEVSHIKTEILDKFCEKYFVFNPVETFDEELNVWTISVDEINMYGEGSTKEEAIEDLINSIQEFETIYVEKIELFTMTESVEQQFYMRKIMRCEKDREKIRKVLGLCYACEI